MWAARMDAAAAVATEFLATEFLKVVVHLENVLTPDPAGGKKVIKAAAVENVRNMLAAVRELNLTNNAQLEVLVSKTEELIKGTDNVTLRDVGVILQDKIREGLTGIADTIEREFVVEAPKRARNIIRAVPPPAAEGAA
jgi:hypothetical protein